jgi:hypothetical protein
VLIVRTTGTGLAVLLAVRAQDRVGSLAANLLDAKQFGIQRLYTQLGSCHGPAGGAPAAGGGGGVPAERIPRGKPPNLARRGEIFCPLTKPVVTAVELQAATEPHALQPRRAARRYLRIRGTSRADSRRSAGVGLAPGPQALPMSAAALIPYI